MKKVYEYSSDKSFLELIDNEHLKEQFVKITVLDWEERPIQEVQGIVTGGNLNLDGFAFSDHEPAYLEFKLN